MMLSTVRASAKYFMVLFVLVSAPASAETVITFDDLSAPNNFANAMPLTNEYAHLGVQFVGTGEVLNVTSNFPGAPQSPPFTQPNFLAFNNNVGAVTPETFLFDPPANFVSIDFAASSATISLTGYLGSDLIQTVQSFVFNNSWNTISLSGARFDRVVFDATGDDGAFVLDNLKFVAVPEPACLSLATFVLVCGAVARRQMN